MDNGAFWYIDGHWVHPNEATISLNDVAVLRGYSVFEALRTYNRRPFYLHDHMERLYRSASLIELHLPYARKFIVDIIHEAIERNPYKHAAIRILVTGGESEDGVIPSGQPVLAVMITPLGERDMERFAKGVRLITSHLQRTIRSLKEASRRNASDALFVNEHGHILEGTRSNFFVFRGDTLVTPITGVLLGVTRKVVLELAEGRFPVEERPILLSELPLIDEAFITSSAKEITPAVQIDDVTIGAGKPGPRTYELEQRFISMIERGEF
jgi:branched-chain amino acid aminotransferase